MDKDDLEENNPLLIGPEISIIPVPSKPPAKIRVRNFLEEEHRLIRHRERSPRGNVRIVSPAEIVKAEIKYSYSRRKSLPLEKCPICKKFFRRMKTHLLKHEEQQRGPDDPLTCKLCKKVFNTYSNLSIHMRTHTGDKPYICDICDKSFSQSCNLVNHLRIHTGERPYKCPHCDRAFTQSGNLTNHIRLHTDEKPFVCHFCDRAFTQSGNLNSHIRNNHKLDDSRNFINFH